MEKADKKAVKKPDINDLLIDLNPAEVLDDPNFQEEMFDLYQRSGDKPEDLTGATPEYRAKYAEWLKKQEA
jgi:hypothetical protein